MLYIYVDIFVLGYVGVYKVAIDFILFYVIFLLNCSGVSSLFELHRTTLYSAVSRVLIRSRLGERIIFYEEC